MDIILLKCASCGAPLSVPDTAASVTCENCHAKLAVRRYVIPRLERIGPAAEPYIWPYLKQSTHWGPKNALQTLEKIGTERLREQPCCGYRR